MNMKKIYLTIFILCLQKNAVALTINDVPPLPDNLKQEISNNLEQMKTKGYVETNSTYPKKLISIGFKNIRFGAQAPDDQSDLKKDVSQIKLAFPYKPVSEAPRAFCPAGMWTDNGWNGIKEFFTVKEIGSCSLYLFNIKISHGEVIFNESTDKHDINNKVSDIYIEGNVNDGFIYRVTWYDKTYTHELECANMNFDKSITNKMIELAKTIDTKMS